MLGRYTCARETGAAEDGEGADTTEMEMAVECGGDGADGRVD